MPNLVGEKFLDPVEQGGERPTAHILSVKLAQGVDCFPFVDVLLNPARPRGPHRELRVRREADMEDARLHELRHRHASHAVSGVPVPVVSRLVGHSTTRMTLRYPHLGDRDIGEAAGRVGQETTKIMGS